MRFLIIIFLMIIVGCVPNNGSQLSQTGKSNIISTTGKDAIPTISVPSAPPVVWATEGDRQAIVNFTVPTSTGGHPILSYVVTSNPDNLSASGTSSPIIIGGLVNGRKYSFSVKAINKIGPSAYSSLSTAITPVAACSALTIANCLTVSKANGESAGSCASGFTIGSCSYRCNSGSWIAVFNNCAKPVVPVVASAQSCTASTIANCVTVPKASGESSGTCAFGYSGYCSYLCSSGTWRSNSNTCLLPSVNTTTDTTAPTVTVFTLPATATTLAISITTLTATDNIAVSSYCLSESSLSSACVWATAKPSSYPFSSAGTKTLYIWAKDAAGNISASKNASVTITLPDTTVPTVTAFSLPLTATTLAISLTTFTATDNIAVSSYCLNESYSPSACSWTTTKPTSYTFTSAGNKNLFAWAKDAAGNISDSKNASVNIILPVTVNLPSGCFMSANPAGTSMTVGSSKSLFVTCNGGSPPTSYRWTVNNGTPITKITNTIQVTDIISTPIAGNTYSITATAINSAGSSASMGFSLNVSGATSSAQVAAVGTNFHTCTNVGRGIQCWGANDYGTLGNGTTSKSLTPVRVSGLSGNTTAISVGAFHVCAIVDGSVYCWGYNAQGQLGNGTTIDSLIPVRVIGLSGNITAITVGFYHSCAIADGVAKCWGSNQNGALGNGTGAHSSTPVNVSDLGNVTAISAGGLSGCVVTVGMVKCWGDNYYGQLGNGTTTKSPTPVIVSGLSGNITSISIDTYHACAVVDGGAQCWGSNGYGKLGNGTYTDSLTPVRVTGLSSNVTAISVASSHSCAIVNRGVQCWGSNGYGKLGNRISTDSTVPVIVNDLDNVTALSVGGLTSCAIAAGVPKCWGYNVNGEYGNGTTESTNNVLAPMSPNLLPAP